MTEPAPTSRPPHLLDRLGEGIVHAAQEGVVTIDQTQRIVMMNPAALRMFGCTAEQALGQELTHLMPARARAHHAEFVRRFAESGEAERAMGAPGMAVGLRTSGEEFPIAGMLSRVEVHDALGPRTLFTALIADLSAQDGLQAQVETLRRQLRDILELAPVAIWVSEDDRIVFANRACLALFGATAPGEVVGRSVYSLLRAESHRTVRQRIAQVLSGQVDHPVVKERVARPDGSVRDVEIVLAALPDHGRTMVQMVINDITQRSLERLEQERSRHELRRLSASVVDAREEERRRIARELHDELGQRLSWLKMELSALGHGARRRAADARVAAMLDMLDETVASVRRISADLRPLMLDDLGLNAAIEALAHESSQRMGVAITVRLGASDPPLDGRASTAVYRMVQESLTNVSRHAHATEVLIELRHGAGELVLTVHDNGVGFPSAANGKEDSFGLLGIRERAYLLGGRMKVDNPPEGGARVTVWLPLRRAGASREAAAPAS